MELYEAMRCAPTTRVFAPDPVPLHVVQRVLDNARFAPSGGNRQAWRVIAATQPDTRRALRDLYLPSWRAYMQATGGAAALADPAGLDRPSIVGGASIYPFVQNVLLGLRAEGLGAALTTLLAPAEPEVKELLSIPEDVVLAAYVLVGRPGEAWPKRLSREPVESFAFLERYGEPLASGQASA